MPTDDDVVTESTSTCCCKIDALPTCHPLCMVWGRKSHVLHEGNASVPVDVVSRETNRGFYIGEPGKGDDPQCRPMTT